MNRIWYKKPAKKWREALPLGNGLMGLMIYGSLKKERICFNDGTLWSGYPKDYNSSDSLESLEEVRSLIFEGKQNQADTLCEKKLTGFYSETFIPLGEIALKFEKVNTKNLVRAIDLSTGIHTVKTNEAESEAFSSYPDKISAYRVTAPRPFSVTIKAKSKLQHKVNVDNALNLIGNAPDYAAPNYLRTERNPIRYNKKKGMAFCLRAEIKTDGTVLYKKNRIIVKNAKSLTLYFATGTGFNGFDKMPDTSRHSAQIKCIELLKKVTKNYNTIKQKHIDDFTKLYNAQSISFEKEKSIPTDKLLKSVKKGADETALCELFYNYGKYMIISGSRKNGQPLNLQGIWNNSVRPPWSSNYTVNINTQMNYWGASRSGLSECIEPLIQMVYEVMQNGKKTAEINYGCGGFACNHNVDIWRKTPPVKGDANYMFEPLCGVWLANEIYAHYKNGYLEEYKDKIKEIVTQAARFANDYLKKHGDYYVVCPSPSPENIFSNGSKKCKLDYASAFDMGLVKQAFKNAVELSDDEELKAEIAKKAPLLYPFKNGRNGICEWHTDYGTPENGHRHFSPLYAFYPGNIIGYYNNAEQTKWIKSLFEYRLKNSGQHIGWSAAWAICLSARLRDTNILHAVIRNLLCNAVFKNLFCVHPPFYFQIDGNLGFVAGINEMLITEENNVVELLPALPESFALAGEVKNIVVNGAQISFSWKNGIVTNIQSDKPIELLSTHLSDEIVSGENISIKNNI